MTTAPAPPTTGPSNIVIDDTGAFRAASPLNEWSADGRMLLLAQDKPLKVRPLPLPMLYQDRLGPGHDGARLGLSKIDRLWREGDTVIMEGTFDMTDPEAVKLAAKVKEKYVRFISLDVDMATAEEVCVDPEGRPAECDDPDAQNGLIYTDWRAMGATLLAHPAYADAIMVSLAASAAFADTPQPDAPIVGYNPDWGCVAPNADGTAWQKADCTAPGAVLSNPQGNAPFDPEAVAESDTDPVPEEEVQDTGSGCVAPDPAREGAWVPADCDAEGAVPANPEGTAPADDVTDAANQAGSLAARFADLPAPTHAGIALKALDTGRVLLLQRSLEEGDPAAGMWEFPGGSIDEGETPEAAAFREFAEETGTTLDPDLVQVVDGWRSPNGVYQGYVCTIPAEGDIVINPGAGRDVVNPDDPEGEMPEVLAWWDLAAVPDLPSLRPEVADTPWEKLADAGSAPAAPAASQAPGAPLAFAVDTSLPWAPREHPWDGEQARQRVADWATTGDTIDGARMGKAFLLVDGPEENSGSYEFGVADVIDGELRLVWGGVTASYAALQGARTAPDITADQKAAALREVATLYRKAADAFDDPTIAQQGPLENATAAADAFALPLADLPPADSPATEADDGRPAQDAGNGCVCEAEDDSGWVPCDCAAEGACTAGPDGQPLEPADTAMGISDCIPCRATTTVTTDTHPSVLTASATGWRPLAAWFDNPRLTAPQPITVDPETGRISGHLAAWGTCHVGFRDRCVTAPRSASGYAYYHTASIPTDQGALDVGLITMDTGHAELDLTASATVSHYDNTGAQAAVVRVGEDEHGIWAAGTVLPFITEEQRLRLSLASFSGDWRQIRGKAELVAALAVNVPGFAVARRRTGAGNQDYALVAAGALHPLPTPSPQADTTVLLKPDAGLTISSAQLDPTFTWDKTTVFDPDDVARRVVARLEERDTRRSRATHATTALARFRDEALTRRVTTATSRVRALAAARMADRIALARKKVERLGKGEDPWADLPTVRRPSALDIELAENWVEKAGGLPPYIKRIQKHLEEKGMGTSQAIATAINVVKKMCANGDTNWPGIQQVSAKSRAEACAAVARWEEMKRQARAS